MLIIVYICSSNYNVYAYNFLKKINASIICKCLDAPAHWLLGRTGRLSGKGEKKS